VIVLVIMVVVMSMPVSVLMIVEHGTHVAAVEFGESVRIQRCGCVPVEMTIDTGDVGHA